MEGTVLTSFNSTIFRVLSPCFSQISTIRSITSFSSSYVLGSQSSSSTNLSGISFSLSSITLSQRIKIDGVPKCINVVFINSISRVNRIGYINNPSILGIQVIRLIRNNRVINSIVSLFRDMDRLKSGDVQIISSKNRSISKLNKTTRISDTLNKNECSSCRNTKKVNDSLT